MCITFSMYIRRTSIKSRKTGESYYTYRLVESIRTQKGVRQQIVLNLGADFSYPRELWPDIAGRIDQILHGELRLFELPNEIEEAAQRYAAKIIRARSSILPNQESQKADPDYHTVDINTLQSIRPRSVSIEHVCYHAARLRRLWFSVDRFALSSAGKPER